MARTKKTKVTPKDTPNASPKTAPINKPAQASKRAPKAAPKAAPKPRPRRTPVSEPMITPDKYTLSIYALPNWDDDHSINPHKYGNGGRALGEFHTEADAKQWLRDNDQYGHFAAVERIAGRIGKSWHVEIETPDDDLSEDDLMMLDPDLDIDDADLVNPAIVRAKIENAKLRAELNASRNGGHGSIGELLAGLKALDEMRGQGTPQKSLAAQIREAKELTEIINQPRREPNPAPASPPIDPEASIFQILARDDGVVDKIAGGIIGKLMRDESSKDEPGWETVAMEAVKNGQAAAMVSSLMSGVQGIFAMIFPQKAQQQTAPSHPDPRAQRAPAIQAQQPAPQVTPEAAQPTQTSVDYHVDVIVTHVMNECANGTPPDAALADVLNYLEDDVESIYYRAVLERVDAFSTLPTGVVIEFLKQSPQGQKIAAVPHVVEWTSRLQELIRQNKAEEDEEAGEDAPDGENAQ